ncbi:MAG: phage integrase N-terminal SAM-like domain-containing protein, partial [Oscillospiraceae bacterium]|nr:phage integrase N-terminal SAM-like domain-containing protein [Oscillospiraceae bacterium]
MNEKQYTLAQAIEIFVRHSEIKGLAKDTIKSYRLYTTKFAEWIGKETPLSDITINDIEEYMEYKRLGGNKAVSVATNVRNLRCFFNFCFKRKMMEHLEITMPRYEKELKEPYSDYEMALLLVKPKGDSWTEYRNWAMVNYFFATGQRLSTVIHIRVKDVDLVNKRVFLLWNKDKIQKYMPLSTQICRVL